MRTALFLLLVWLSAGVEARAHQFEPAVLQVFEQDDGQLRWRWQPSTLPGSSVTPRFSASCGVVNLTQDRDASGLLTCQISGLAVEAVGWRSPVTEVLLHLQRRGGDLATAVLTPSAPRWAPDLSEDASAFSEKRPRRFVRLGVEHVLSGWDHLAFVLVLMLLARGRALLWTITAFTVGHSITLVGATLGGWRLAQGPIEALIALSIVWMAREAALSSRSGGSDGRAQDPWVVACGFGLLHGLGFASALSAHGGEAVDGWALGAFNVGVEFGQMAVVLAAILPLAALQRHLAGRLGVACALGGFGMYCFGVRLWAF